MKKIKCTIIQDILPLYKDDVVSTDTKEMVKEHLNHCESCTKEYEYMQEDMVIPTVKIAPILQKTNRKWRMNKWIIGGLSVAFTSLILFSSYFLVFHYDTVIPYSEGLVEVEQQDNNELVSRFNGVSYYSFNAVGPFILEVNGKEKQVIFLYYTKTIANSPTKKTFSNGEERHEQDLIFPLDKEEEVDAIYYADYNIKKVMKNENYWNDVLQEATLLWEK